MIVRPAGRARDDVRLPREGAAGVDADDVSRGRRQHRSPADRRRISRARRARHRSRPRAAHKKFGKLPWKDVVMPAVELAEQGFVLSPALARSLNARNRSAWRRFRRRSPRTASPAAANGRPAIGWCSPISAGRSGRSPPTAPTSFYKGWIADRIAEDMKANGGLITKEDLAAYQARERRPGARHLSRLRHHLDAAAQLRRRGADRDAQHPRAAEPRSSKGLLTAPALHLQTEAMRRAYLDRARYLGDPDFGEIPVARLTSKSHAKQVASSIDHAARVEQRRARQGHRSTPRRRRSPTRPRISRCSTGPAWRCRTPTRSKAATARTSSSRARASSSTTRWATSTGSRATTNATGDIGTPPNLDRPGQADAQLDDADDRREERQAGAGHRPPGRPHDHQHRVRPSSSASPSTA